ncbi:MAG: 16S rRNA (uracil(1498)-N(3))-methyltransferase [Pseudomonadota bacterium]
MRANYKLPRLFLETPLGEGGSVELDKTRSNYLLNVLRMRDGDELLTFNGRDGEWRSTLEKTGKKNTRLIFRACERRQPTAPDLVFCFAPLKVGRLDYMVQKAVEMGAGVLQPVFTEFTQNHRINMEKMRSWTIEAAEQCGVLALPQCREPVKFGRLIDDWDDAIALIFCDEDHDTHDPMPSLEQVGHSRLGVLIGPEGGFSDNERASLRAQPFVTSIPLGPRILRADTAAVAALAIIQAKLGDWKR